MEQTGKLKQLIWDLPTRVFHWAFAASVLGAWGFAKLSPEESPLFYLHMLFGVSAGVLLVWRIIWGLVGSKHARFSALLFSPRSLIDYFKSVASGRGQYHPGHNPAGSLAIWALLGLIGLAVFSGLSMGFMGESLEEVHEVSTNVVIFVIAAHVIGVVLATKMNKENYVAAMFHGKKRAEPSDAIAHSSPLAALSLVVLFIVGVSYFAKGFDLASGSFTPPGTAYTVQFGEREGGEHHHGEGGEGHGHDGEHGDHDGDDD
jgi:cytochrome b